MITRDYRPETGVRHDAASAGLGLLKSIAGAYGRWLARRHAIRQLYRLDRPVPRDLATDRSEFNSIVFGDVAERRRSDTRH